MPKLTLKSLSVISLLTLCVASIGATEIPAESENTPIAGKTETRAVPVNWRYPVAPPSLEVDKVASANSAVEPEPGPRAEIARQRRLSERVIDEYSRLMENCRYESTLHFDDRDRARLVGNDQACQSRYQRLMREEQKSLDRRISRLRSDVEGESLHPVVVNDLN